MRPFLIRWVVTTFAVAVAAQITGMQTSSWGALICMALFLGIINAIIRPVMLLLSLPFIIVTLGVAILIVNALLFWLAAGLVPGIRVDGFWQAFFGSIIVSLVSWPFSAFFKGSDGQYYPITHHGQLSGGGEKPVAGRVVDETPRQ